MPKFEHTLGRYRLIRKLGQGGLGEVHLASCHGAAGFEKLVAVKRLREEWSQDPKHDRFLQDEARLGVELEHPNLVQTLDLGEEAGCFYIVMEYIRGFSAAKALSFLAAKEVQLPVPVALHIFHGVCRALEYVHARPGLEHGEDLFHGDVSAANLMLSASGRIALGDFGVAAMIHRNPESLAGKWSYVPPEALLGARLSAGWDLFALGALLYELLTGTKAFPCSTFAERSALPEEPLTLLQHRPKIDKKLSELVSSFLSADPNARPRSAKEMREALTEAVPPRAEDEDEFLRYVSGLFAEGDFQRANGALPVSAYLDRDDDMFSEATEFPTANVRLHKPLRFGFSLAHGADSAKSYGNLLADYLSPSIERPIRPFLLGDYATLLDCLLRGDIDVAWMPPLLMAEAATRGAGLVAVAERFGSASYTGCVVVREDSRLECLKDAHGKSMAWVDRSSASGYVFPRKVMEAALGPLEDAQVASSFHGSHLAVCQAVARGWTDLGATYVVSSGDGEVQSAAWQQLSPEHEPLRILASTSSIPGDCIAARPNMSENWMADVREALLAMHSSEEGKSLMAASFRADRFVGGDLDDYEGLLLARNA